MIRPLRPSDLDAVLALNNDNVPAVSGLDAAELSRLAASTSISLVAELDAGTFAGFCMVMPPGIDYASLNYAWFSRHAGELGYGSFAYLDPSMHHYAAASGETVIQIHGKSPVKFNYINPADDPTPKK